MKTKTLHLLSFTLCVLLFSCKKESVSFVQNNFSPDVQAATNAVNSVVYCFGGVSIVTRDLATGQILWTAPLSVTIGSLTGVMVVGNAAYFTSYADSSYAVNKFNLDTKSLVWQKVYDKIPGDSMIFLKRLVYESGKIFAQVDHIQSRGEIATNTKITALDTLGNTLWQSYFYSTQGQYRSIQKSDNPTVYRGVLVTGLGHDMAAVDATTGDLIWRKKIDRSTNYLMNPCVSNGVIYSGITGLNSGSLFALKLNTGKLLWQTPLDVGFQEKASPAVVNNDVVVNGYTKIFALNTATGAKHWEYADGVGASEYPFFRGVTVMDSIIYATNNQATKTYAINSNTGQIKYTTGYLSYNTDNAPPVAANGYLMTGNSWLAYKCSLAATGNAVWDSGNGGAIEFVIKDSKGRTYHTTESGLVQ